MRQFAKIFLAMVVTASLLLLTVIPAAFAELQEDPHLSREDIVKLLRKRIKYVFVIFNENHSFDNEFGTFPGVNGLYSDGQKSRAAANTLGFTQTYTDNISGQTVTVLPFRIGPEQNSTVVDSVDHTHTGLAVKLHLVNDVPQMDKFAYDEYYRFAKNGGMANNVKGTQFARLVMSHIDCDTIPFFWKWAGQFTIFDNIYATEDTPSTPNAVAMIAGQSGETQWVKHGSNGQTYTNVNGHTGTTQGPPLVNDPQPFYGSQFDTTTVEKQPANANDGYRDNNIASNLTFASLPLTFQGRNIITVMAQNLNPSFDMTDIQKDIPYIQSRNIEPINWRWYQEGYDLESTDTGTVSHNSYVSHHQGPQYFGYLANTPPIRPNLRGMTDFFSDIKNKALPESGVFYIRGGYINQMGLVPPVTNPLTPADEVVAIRKAKAGDDDHPAYTDRQISEAMAARVINAIAADPELWYKSAIIIAYDESDGFYDHVPPRILSYGPDGLPLSRGIRVPLILISPYARAHAVSHAEGDHNAIIETINDIFNLPPLASLPDEAEALKDGNSQSFNKFGPSGFEQKHLGPRDINSPITDSLLSGFDLKRLMGILSPLPAALAIIPDNVVNSLPHYGGNGCQAIGIEPEDVRQGIVNKIPSGFNPLPSTYPAAN